MHAMLVPVAFATVLSAWAAPAGAITVTYANFAQSTNAKLFRYARQGPGAGTGNRLYTTAEGSAAAGEIAVDFRYLVDMPPALQGIQAAFLSFDASTTETLTVNGDTSSQGGFSGTVSIRRAVPLNGQDNLLTINFGNATLFSLQGSGAATYTIAIPAGGSFMSQTSAFLDFGTVMAADFALSFSALTPKFQGEHGGYGESFRANATGTFASSPPPSVVPEPETWALLITGFGLVGYAARRRAGTRALA